MAEPIKIVGFEPEVGKKLRRIAALHGGVTPLQSRPPVIGCEIGYADGAITASAVGSIILAVPTNTAPFDEPGDVAVPCYTFGSTIADGTKCMIFNVFGRRYAVGLC